MKKLARFLAAAALSTVSAAAGEHLAPLTVQERANASHDSDLTGAFDNSVILRMHVQPSFRTSYAVVIEERGGRDYIVGLQFSPQLNDTLMRYDALKQAQTHGASAEEIAALKKALPRDPKDAKPDRCEVEIDAALTTKLSLVWKAMLDDARPEHDNGLDGTFYYFYLRDGGLMGKVWSPIPWSPAGRLVEIGEKMLAYCQSQPQTILRETDLLLNGRSP